MQYKNRKYFKNFISIKLLKPVNLEQRWPTRGKRATVWHGGVLTVAREDLLKN